MVKRIIRQKYISDLKKIFYNNRFNSLLKMVVKNIAGIFKKVFEYKLMI
jgi:hypothetical protein